MLFYFVLDNRRLFFFFRYCIWWNFVFVILAWYSWDSYFDTAFLFIINERIIFFPDVAFKIIAIESIQGWWISIFPHNLFSRHDAISLNYIKFGLYRSIADIIWVVFVIILFVLPIIMALDWKTSFLLRLNCSRMIVLSIFLIYIRQDYLCFLAGDQLLSRLYQFWSLLFILIFIVFDTFTAVLAIYIFFNRTICFNIGFHGSKWDQFVLF